MQNNESNNWWERTPAVLFVDDEQSVLRSLNRMFRKEDYDVHLAESGDEALKIMEETPIDVVVSDQRMPKMTGIQLLQQVKERWPGAVRIILSGYTEINELLGAINEGEVYRFITKPWDDDAFKALVRNSIEKSRILNGFSRLVEKLREVSADHEIETTTDLDKNKLHAELRDHGKGLDEEQMSKIFQCLVESINLELQGPGTEKLSGLIAKNLGAINFSAEVGAGMLLSVDIPVEGEEDEGEGDEGESEK